MLPSQINWAQSWDRLTRIWTDRRSKIQIKEFLGIKRIIAQYSSTFEKIVLGTLGEFGTESYILMGKVMAALNYERCFFMTAVTNQKSWS
jgi:hypothetical protein